MKKITFKIKITTVKKQMSAFYTHFLLKTLKAVNIPCFVINLPKKKKKFTFLKSPHVHKKAREQFEVITYSSVIIIKQEIKKSLLKYLILNKPAVTVVTLQKA